MHTRTLTVRLFALVLSGHLSAQIGVGDAMPEIAVDAKFNFEPFAPEKLSDLKGPAFLVEYWATW